jgi:class 3 adenylate cyclase
VACAERYGGHIHQYAGDGVLAYFGYPVAGDNDAERAVLTGLGIIEGTRRLAADLRQRGEEDISVRVGIHTGMVVVGVVTSRSRLLAVPRVLSARDRLRPTVADGVCAGVTAGAESCHSTSAG